MKNLDRACIPHDTNLPSVSYHDIPSLPPMQIHTQVREIHTFSRSSWSAGVGPWVRGIVENRVCATGGALHL